MTDAAAPPLPPIANPSGDGAADTPPPAKVRKLHCNERSHNVRMHLHERFCEQRVEALQSSFLDRQPRGKTTPTRDELDAQAAQWENAKSELEAELQEIHKSVVPYIKLHLCEIRPASRRDDSSDSVGDGAAAVSRWSGECCSLTSWRPTEEHRELFTPGREYVLLGCAMHARFRPTNSLAFPKPNYQPATSLPMVPHPYSAAASSHYLQLATSRMTNIVPYDMSRKRVTQMHSTRPTSNAHLYSPFLRAPIFLRPDELLSMSRGAEFDCVCLVLWANDEGDQTKSSSVGVKPATPSTPSGSGGGSWKRTRRLLCLGLSGDLMVVEVKESEESLHFTQAIQTPQVMSMENLHYGVYEKKLRLHSVSSTVMSRFTSKGGVQLATSDAPLAATTSHAAYAQPDIAHFQAWLAQPTTALLCELAMARSRRIMDGSWHRDAAINTLNKDEFKHVRKIHIYRTRATSGVHRNSVVLIPSRSVPLLFSAAAASFRCVWPCVPARRRALPRMRQVRFARATLRECGFLAVHTRGEEEVGCVAPLREGRQQRREEEVTGDRLRTHRRLLVGIDDISRVLPYLPHTIEPAGLGQLEHAAPVGRCRSSMAAAAQCVRLPPSAEGSRTTSARSLRRRRHSRLIACSLVPATARDR